ncbi:serine hydrolase [Oxalobacteraceae bacterium]|nr:serine hydrolase [Oxalobacteraceae bacterium]
MMSPLRSAALVLACATACAALPATASASGAAATDTPPATPLASAPASGSAYDLEGDVRAVLKAFDVPGMAVAIVKDGKVVATSGFGVRRLGDPAPVDGQTQFEIASNSKAFTATALAMLVDEGKLAWDDPVTRHLPGFQMYDAYVTGAMTVRDLLVHRSGLGLGAGDLLWWPTTTFSADEIIARLRYIKPATSFRNSYAYDNLLYIVAGKIIADKAGKPWGEVMRERIFAPLGMNASNTSVAAMTANANHAAPHSIIGSRNAVVRPMPVENAAGAVGINTNAEDMARWMTVLLDGGRIGEQGRLFSAEQGREMWSAQTPMKIREPKPALAATRANFAAYGLGFNLRDYHGRKIATHGGALQGFYSSVVMVPDEKLGIAILTNAENSPAMQSLQWRILDHYLKVAPSDWIGIYARQRDDSAQEEAASQAKARAARAARSSPSLALAAYEGMYQDPWYGNVSIGTEGKRQVMRFSRTPDLTGELEHFQHDTFIVRWRDRNFNADAYVSFALNPDGSIERMKMAPVSESTDFSYDFADLLFTPVKPATPSR